MGTLIQTVYDTEAAELRMLGYLGYDVTTFGNHEYDYRSKGLANMLKAAKNSGETVPAAGSVQCGLGQHGAGWIKRWSEADPVGI